MFKRGKRGYSQILRSTRNKDEGGKRKRETPRVIHVHQSF